MADASHVQCPSCLRSLTAEEVGFLLEEGILTDACGEEFTMDTVLVNPLPSARRFGSLETVREARWFHATTRPTWHADVTEADVFVHVGTEEAALDRMMGFVGTLHEPAEAAENFYLYELELAEDTRIAKAIAVDSNEDYSALPPQEQSYDAQRYLNRWESPGSLSLVVSPFKLRVVGRRVVTPQEAYAVDSIYNADTSGIYRAMENTGN